MFFYINAFNDAAARYLHYCISYILLGVTGIDRLLTIMVRYFHYKKKMLSFLMSILPLTFCHQFGHLTMRDVYTLLY